MGSDVVKRNIIFWGEGGVVISMVAHQARLLSPDRSPRSETLLSREGSRWGGQQLGGSASRMEVYGGSWVNMGLMDRRVQGVQEGRGGADTPQEVLHSGKHRRAGRKREGQGGFKNGKTIKN